MKSILFFITIMYIYSIKKIAMSYPIPVGTTVNVPGLNSMTITQLHALMNRCDISKDAKEEPSALQSDLFLKSANSLFPVPMKGYKSVLDLLEQGIMDNRFLNGSLGASQSISCLRSDPINYLGDTYIYGAQDSGYKFSDINPVMKQVLTPGSFSDPAKREKEGILEPYNKTSISPILKYIGFDELSYDSDFSNGIQNNGKTVSSYNTICNIRLSGSVNGNKIMLNEKRNYDHDHADNTTVDYFGGNTEKNTWLNDPRNKNNLSEANLYILSKLLGDTAQVVFVYYLFQNNNDSYNSTNTCLFTTDNVVETRGKLLGVPTCKQDGKEDENKGKAEKLKEKKFRRVLFTQPILDPTQLAYSNIYLFRDECLANNRKIIVSLRAILLDKQVALSNNIYQLNDGCVEYINSIINAIDTVNNFILEQVPDDKSRINPNDEVKIKNMMLACRASILIKDHSPSKGFVINMNVNKLFPSEIAEYLGGETDTISEYRKLNRGANKFSDQLIRTGASLQKGGKKFKKMVGGDDIKEEASRMSRKIGYLSYEENKTFIEFLVYNGIGTDSNESYFEFFLFVIPYFRFIGETCYDVDVLKMLYNEFFLKEDEIAASYKSFVNWYVNNVINPREVQLATNGVPVVDSDQRIYLSEYGINTQENINEIFINSEVRIREQAAEEEEYQRLMDRLSQEAAINIAAQPLVEEPSIPVTMETIMPQNIQTGIKRGRNEKDESDETVSLEEPMFKKSVFAFGGNVSRKYRKYTTRGKHHRKVKIGKKSRKNRRTRRKK